MFALLAACVGLLVGGRSPSTLAVPTGYLVVPVRFSDTVNKPVFSKSKLEDLFFKRDVGVVPFYKACSYGKFDLSKTVIGDPVTLPKPTKDYVSRGQAWERSGPGFFSHQRLADDLSGLLNQKYDLKSYFGVFIFPNAYDDVPQGGSGIDANFTGADGTQFLQKLAYVEPNTSTPCFVVHEIGHHLNFSHVHIDRNPGQTASAMSFVGKSYPGVGTVGCDHLMWQKKNVGWLEESESTSISSVGTHRVTLVARSSPKPGLKLATVRLSESRVVTLEALLPTGLDLLSDLGLYGLLVNTVDEKKCTFANFGQLSDEAIPLTQLSASRQPVFLLGEEWVSPEKRVTVHVDSMTDSLIRITIQVQ